MADFALAFSPLRALEGGYANSSYDAGGETYAGISRVYNPNWEGWKTIDGEKASLESQAGGYKALDRRLSTNQALQAQVGAFYRAEYWDALSLSDLPQELANELFEQAVNLGRGHCVKHLQLVCNAMNWAQGKALFADLAIDGAMGPATKAALQTLVAGQGKASAIIHALNCLQGAHYINLGAQNPSQRRWLSGWMKRTN